MQKAIHWSGVFPAVTTQFTADGELDAAAMQKLYDWQIRCGADGLVMVGSLGENSTLSSAEKLDVLQIALETADGRVPVLVTVAENSTRDACRFAADAQQRGAHGLMVLPGMRYLSDRHETLVHYRAVAAASDLPVMIYNNPLAYGVDIRPDMLAELADEPKFQAIKESSGDVRRVTDIFNAVGDRYAVFTGVDDLALESLAAGVQGWVAGLVCAFPQETVAIYRLMRAGRLAEALALYRWFSPLLHLDVSTKLVQNIKLAELAVGYGTGHVRAPRLPLTGDERVRVQAVIDDALACRPVMPLH